MMPIQEMSEVVRLHRADAYRMALKLTGGRQDEAQDLVQDGLIKIWRVLPEQAPQSFKGWMYRVLHNLYIDKIRHKNRHAETSLDAPVVEEGLSLEDRLADARPSSEDLLVREEKQVAVQKALSHLEEDLRLPVTLCDMEGMSYEEIAKIAACPVGTVRSRIHRGRSKLRQALAFMAATAAVSWALWRIYAYPVLWKPLEVVSPPAPQYHAVAFERNGSPSPLQDLP